MSIAAFNPSTPLAIGTCVMPVNASATVAPNNNYTFSPNNTGPASLQIAPASTPSKFSILYVLTGTYTPTLAPNAMWSISSTTPSTILCVVPKTTPTQTSSSSGSSSLAIGLTLGIPLGIVFLFLLIAVFFERVKK